MVGGGIGGAARRGERWGWWKAASGARRALVFLVRRRVPACRGALEALVYDLLALYPSSKKGMDFTFVF